MSALHAVVIVVVSFFVASVPFSNIAAHVTRGTDLRDVGHGTVSGSSLYRVAGFTPLAIAGVLDVAKGAVGPLLATSAHPALRAVAAAAAVAGHDWSPWLRGAGGRGVSTAMGAFLVIAWPGTALLLGGLAVGWIIHRAGFVTFLAILALAPLLAATNGADAALAGALVAAVMLLKRAAGNAPPGDDTANVLVHRLLYDHDPS